MANRNWSSGGKLYSMHTSPVLIDCNFVVDNTHANGISSLKGPTISNVYMHTSASASSTNPAVGTIVVQIADNYNKLLSAFSSVISPTSGSGLKIDNSALTAGVAYSISTLGDATAAQWIALGVPAGITPAVGVNFIAASVGAGANSSTSLVMASATNGSGIANIEIVSDPAVNLYPSQLAQSYGPQLILQCYDYAGAKAAPANGSVINLAFLFSNSSVTVQGE